MDEDTWTDLAPWRKTPMWCGSRPVTKKQINSDADAFEKARNKQRIRPSMSAEHGYKRPFKRNVRKIGFRS
jgi:hypothetical protein